VGEAVARISGDRRLRDAELDVAARRCRRLDARPGSRVAGGAAGDRIRPLTLDAEFVRVTGTEIVVRGRLVGDTHVAVALVAVLARTAARILPRVETRVGDRFEVLVLD